VTDARHRLCVHALEAFDIVLKAASLHRHCQNLLVLGVRLHVDDRSIAALKDQLAFDIHFVSIIGLKH